MGGVKDGGLVGRSCNPGLGSTWPETIDQWYGGWWAWPPLPSGLLAHTLTRPHKMGDGYLLTSFALSPTSMHQYDANILFLTSGF